MRPHGIGVSAHTPIYLPRLHLVYILSLLNPYLLACGGKMMGGTVGGIGLRSKQSEDLVDHDI